MQPYMEDQAMVIELTSPFKYSSACRHSTLVSYEPALRDLAECVRDIQEAAKKGLCGDDFASHGTFHYGALAGGSQRKCGLGCIRQRSDLFCGQVVS